MGPQHLLPLFDEGDFSLDDLKLVFVVVVRVLIRVVLLKIRSTFFITHSIAFLDEFNDVLEV